MGGAEESEMLMIYEVVLDGLEELRPVMAEIGRRDSDLARQMRRAVTSVALNISEGEGSQGGNKRSRYHSALGSARETVACLDVAERLYGITVDVEVRARWDRVTATLFKLSR